jgi:uncharacterized protein (DUF302 family)
MESFDYTVSTEKSVDEATTTIERKTAEKGFRVLATHDIAATLAEKGFPREPLKIVEVCGAKYASEVLAKDIKIALMLPCPISVYSESGRTQISTMRPTAISRFYPKAGVEELAAEVEKIVLGIVDEAR